MKIEKQIEDRDDVNSVIEVPYETETLISSVTQHKGHTMFEINCTTGEIIPAKYEEINANIVTGKVSRKIIVNKNCLYISCLNKKNSR